MGEERFVEHVVSPNGSFSKMSRNGTYEEMDGIEGHSTSKLFYARHADGSFRASPGISLNFYPLPDGTFLATEGEFRYPIKHGLPDFSQPKQLFFGDDVQKIGSNWAGYIVQASGLVKGNVHLEMDRNGIVSVASQSIGAVNGPAFSPSKTAETENGYFLHYDAQGQVEVVHGESGALAAYGGKDAWIGRDGKTFVPKVIWEHGVSKGGWEKVEEPYFFASSVQPSEKEFPKVNEKPISEFFKLKDPSLCRLDNNLIVRRSDGKTVDSNKILPRYWQQPWGVTIAKD